MATSLTLRNVKGSELTFTEVDDNFTNLQTTADAALPAADAVVITDTKATPVGADTVIIRDSADGNAPKLAALSTLPTTGMANPMTTAGDAIIGGAAGAPTRLPIGTNGHVMTAVAGVPAWAAPSGGGAGGLDPLNLWDYWYYSRIGNNNVAANDMFLGAPISTGTNSTALPTTGMAGFNSQGVFIRSSTTANGGYRYQTSSLVADYFGTISHKFRGQFMWLTAFTNVTVRLGYHDSTTSADAVDGAYFEIVGATCSAKTANNSTRTTNATTVTLSLSTAYTFDIDVNAAGTSARFRVYAGNSPTPILDVTNTENIPTTSARAFGAGIVATESSVTASDIGILYGLGVGTVEGFARTNGVVAIAPSAFTAGQWTATAGDAQIVLNITDLPSAGSDPITALQYRLNGGSAVGLTGTGTGERTISSLTNATSYDVEIRQVNAVGNGPWSDIKTRTPVAAGGTPVVQGSAASPDSSFGLTAPITLPAGFVVGSRLLVSAGSSGANLVSFDTGTWTNITPGGGFGGNSLWLSAPFGSVPGSITATYDANGVHYIKCHSLSGLNVAANPVVSSSASTTGFSADARAHAYTTVGANSVALLTINFGGGGVTGATGQDGAHTWLGLSEPFGIQAITVRGAAGSYNATVGPLSASSGSEYWFVELGA